MTASRQDPALLATLVAVQRLIERYDNRGLIIDGIAVGLIAVPRTTLDVDAVLLIPDDDIARLVNEAEQVGLTPRISEPEAFARRSRVLLLEHRDTATPVDISLGLLPFEHEAIERGVWVEIQGFQVHIPTPEDLIIMKAVAHRPQDLADIRSILDMQPDLDRERIQFWLEQFAAALDMPELWEDVRAWL
jgi:hypothetical protein